MTHFFQKDISIKAIKLKVDEDKSLNILTSEKYKKLNF